MATQVTISGNLADAEGTALTGTITFRPSSPFYDGAGTRIVGTAPVIATLSSGALSVVLYATDDADTTAADATYTITEDFTGADGAAIKRTYKAAVPSASATLRYEALVEVESQPQYSYATSASVASSVASWTRFGDGSDIGDPGSSGRIYSVSTAGAKLLYVDTGTEWAGTTAAPLAHVSSHLAGGSDPITGLGLAQIGQNGAAIGDTITWSGAQWQATSTALRIPWVQHFLPWMGVSAEVGTWALAQASSYIGGGAYTNSASAAQNDAISFEVPVVAGGTYTVRLVYRSLTSGPILTVAFDGATAGTVDTYAAVNAPNQVGEVVGHVMGGSTGVQTLTLTAASKHASSTGYRMDIHAVALIRTA